MKGVNTSKSTWNVVFSNPMERTRRTRDVYKRQILSLQEQEVMRAEYGEAQQEAVEAEEHPHEKLMTARQKWSLVVFGLTFVVMIIGFIPWESFGIDVFDAGAATEEVTETVSGDDISATWSDDEVGGELSFDGDVTGTVTTEEQVSEGWSAFLTGLPLDVYKRQTSTPTKGWTWDACARACAT